MGAGVRSPGWGGSFLIPSLNPQTSPPQHLSRCQIPWGVFLRARNRTRFPTGLPRPSARPRPEPLNLKTINPEAFKTRFIGVNSPGEVLCGRETKRVFRPGYRDSAREGSLSADRCRASLEQIHQSRPDSGLGLSRSQHGSG